MKEKNENVNRELFLFPGMGITVQYSKENENLAAAIEKNPKEENEIVLSFSALRNGSPYEYSALAQVVDFSTKEYWIKLKGLFRVMITDVVKDDIIIIDDSQSIEEAINNAVNKANEGNLKRVKLKILSDDEVAEDEAKKITKNLKLNLVNFFEKYVGGIEGISEKARYEEYMKDLEKLSSFQPYICDAINLIRLLSGDEAISAKIFCRPTQVEYYHALNSVLDELIEKMDDIRKKKAEDDKKNAIVNLLAGSQNAATQNLVKRLTATYLNIKQFIPEESRKAIEEDFDELKTSSHSSQESVIIKHLKFLLELPWGKHDPETKDLNKVKQFLDADHYGLRPIKEKISRYIALKMMNPKAKSGILCFAGPPGVGKTSITSSIASALGLQFVRMSLGGVSDEADIRGHRRTYVGADPGRILTAIKRAGTLNPVVVIDEIDKVGSGNIKGDISSALLEVLDPEQNFAFIDHYAGCPFDLSKVFFILTANDLKMIPEPLRDRAEIIILPGYTKEEKVNIATKFLIKKQEELVNPNKEFNLRINDEDIKKIIEDYTAEAGVRELERKISALYQRSAELFLTTNKKEFNASDIIKGFGPGYHSERARKTVPGSAIGLYWSMIGGGIVYFETVFVEGLSKSISRTGKMGESMIESTKDIMTLLRERYANADELKDLTAHISAITNAGIDGPSAGIAGLLSAYSALKKIPVKPYLAMTGKIDILGNVLPIGGVLEKLLGAEQAGIKEVIVPADNRENVEWELREYKLDLKIHYVKNTDQAMIIAFGRKFVKKEKKD